MSQKFDQMQRTNQIVGVKLARGLHPINHLLFADDCLIFVQAELKQMENLLMVFNSYERLAGQKLNMGKSEFSVIPNMDDIVSNLFSEFLNMPKVSKHSKYLGLPLLISQNKSDIFRSLEDKMKEKITDWKNITLSWNGKESLVKACLQAMPIYTMTCFKIPKGLCSKLSILSLNFWWN